MIQSDPKAASASDQPGAFRAIEFAWLVQARYVVVAGQALAIAAGAIMGTNAPPPVAAVLTLLLAVSNVLAVRIRFRPQLPTLLLLFDTAVLTVLLGLSGGVANPFSILYLVQITFAAAALETRGAVAVAAASIASYAWLFLEPGTAGGGHDHEFGSHLRGMWGALAVSALLVATLVLRLRRTIEKREAELIQERGRVARSEKLGALATLAAGAAHELATPLGTIAVVISDLRRSLDRKEPVDIEAELDLIRRETQRCRAILDDLAAGAGEVPGEAPSPVEPQALVAAALSSSGAPSSVSVGGSSALPSVIAPPRAVERALSSLIRNALDSGSAPERVRVDIAVESDVLTFRIRDGGAGMTPEQISRAGEPFWTTKPEGRGMGLGLFLARATAEQLGGRLDLESSPQGTVASLHIPVRGHAG